MREAVVSAIRDVLKANTGASVQRVDLCDLVSQAEMARRCGRSRQQVGQWVSGKRGPGTFPPPASGLGGTQPLWNWCEVSEWLYQNEIVGEESLEEARAIGTINSVLSYLEHRQSDPAFVDEVARVVSVHS